MVYKYIYRYINLPFCNLLKFISWVGAVSADFFIHFHWLRILVAHVSSVLKMIYLLCLHWHVLILKTFWPITLWQEKFLQLMKWNEIKYIFLIKFTGNTWKQNRRKLIKERKIMKKCLGWINLLVVSRGKCNNDIKRENSTEILSIINRHILHSKAKTRRYALHWNDKT